ncbi:hypothetical protein HE1_01045 [Holospora elegans E1]|uniref:Uncharacterized protein n=1 Tax=Holospora elegans E1 TaxID=1427503 RepID=A0A023DYW6_9PROT|nr:hypothetical protein HE1_01045 [Holospora elegans E1]
MMRDLVEKSWINNGRNINPIIDLQSTKTTNKAVNRGGAWEKGQKT